MNNKSNTKIVALSDREHLLERMALTFSAEGGGTEEAPYSTQQTIALAELLDNSSDAIERNEIPRGRIDVTFKKDGTFIIKDNGGGVPVTENSLPDGTPASSMYLAFCRLRAGANFSHDKNRFTRGTNGVGSSSTLMLAKTATVTTYHDGTQYSLHFKDGLPQMLDDKTGKWVEQIDYMWLDTKPDQRSKTEQEKFGNGTTTEILLDRNNFKAKDYGPDYQYLIDRLRGAGYLIPNLTISVNDQVNKEKYTFSSNTHDGFNKLFNELYGDLELVTPIEERNGSLEYNAGSYEKALEYKLLFAYSKDYEMHFDSYVNTIHTNLGGVHNKALEKAWSEAITEKLYSTKGMLSKTEKPPLPSDIQEGMIALLSIRTPDPEFTSQIKNELGGRQLEKTLYSALKDDFVDFLRRGKNRDTLLTIGDKIMAAHRSRQEATEKKLAKKTSKAVKSSDLPVKLADCDMAGSEFAELYICEGDSAAGTIKQARDASFQAVIPIRGKMLNCFKASKKQIYNNKEILDIATALGAGMGESFDINKCRYSRVLIASDADIDGFQIANLVVTVFWAVFRPMIEQGRLYKTMPPLYEITPKGESPLFAVTGDERDKIIESLKKKKKTYTIDRFKGLGQMPKESFWETVLDPTTRRIQRITMEDVETFKSSMDLTMGDNSQERKDFMEDNYHIAISSGMIEGYGA